MNYPEFEISLHQRDTVTYAVQVRFIDPDQDAEQRAEAFPVRFDFAQLRELADPRAYGLLLGRSLLGNPEVRSCLDKARTATQLSERRLRVRLWIDKWLTSLHDLRWETLCDPETERPLLLEKGILFSRHLASFDMRPIRLRSRSSLRALIAVANPERVKGGKSLATLGAIDVQAELQRARDGLSGIALSELVQPDRVTLPNLLARVKEEYDIVYLVCHGAHVDGEPRLWLEDENGGPRLVSGVDLVEGLARLIRLPRLVVLISCQSGGTGSDTVSEDNGALSALGPRLAAAGIPAVIAMQGNVLQSTVARFMPVFFQELHKDGQIDRAVLEARCAIHDQPDYWSPVLYTRLVNGRLWYEHRFSGGLGFDAWPGLLNQIRKGECIPILGSGLLEPFIGSPREIASRWAGKYGYPTIPSMQLDLPQVSQFLSTTQGPDFPRDEFVHELSEEILSRWPVLNQESNSTSQEDPPQRLLRLLTAARNHACAKNPSEAHQVLARLSCPIYITTNPDNLLKDALVLAKKPPHEELCRWHEEMPAFSLHNAAEPYEPSVQQPLIFQLFGHLKEMDSLVLTEDDYFNYLIGITRLQSNPEPSAVQTALTKSGLMFLGFRMDDWDFRVFVRFLNHMRGSKLRRKKLHVAVQIEPDEGRGVDPGRTRRFLEKYFGSPEMQFEIYWGSVEDFLNEVNSRWTP